MSVSGCNGDEAAASGGSAGGIRSELLELADRLRQEKLYIENEKAQLRELNEKVKETSEWVSRRAWVAHQQRANLERLTLGKDASTTPTLCCRRANLLERTAFQDAYKTLNYQETLYSEFLRKVRDRPKLLAACLAAGDKLPAVAAAGTMTEEVVSVLFAGLYGSCVMPDEERSVLKVLQHLVASQLAVSNNPRKLMRQKSCAFSRLYKCFKEELFSAKLFLTAALYEPILAVLSEDEIFLDVDPSKAVIRFAPSERARKFGQEGAPEYEEKVRQHRAFVVGKLEALTMNFVRGLRDSSHCFPRSFARLLGAARRLVEPHQLADSLCVDAIFALFVCPAMVDPNPVGIIDAPVTYIARSNLMQVAQVLQVLAMWKLEPGGGGDAADLYQRFDKGAVPAIVEEMLAVPFDDDDDDVDAADEPLARSAVLMTRRELETLVGFFREVAGDPDADVAEELRGILSTLPEAVPGGELAEAEAAAAAAAPPEEPRTVLVVPIAEASDPPGFLSEDHVVRSSCNGPAMAAAEEEKKQQRRRDAGGFGTTSQDDGDDLEAISEAASSHSLASSLEECDVDQAEDPMITDNLSDMVSANVSGRGTPNVSGRDTPSSQVTEDEPRNNQQPQQLQPHVQQQQQAQVQQQQQQAQLPPSRRPRPSRPSWGGASSLTSAGGLGGGGGGGGGRTPSRKMEQEQQPDLEEKFGRFEIRPPGRPPGLDETVSLVSDTWSTDVLASDTEDRQQPSDVVIGGGLKPPPAHAHPSTSSLLDVAEETGSEAWSIDVMASDSESLRMGEVDNDDAASVARSDDTRFTDDTTRSDPSERASETARRRSSDTNSILKKSSSERGAAAAAPPLPLPRQETTSGELKRTASSSSSGAIPKSISFDKETEEKQKSGKAFLKGFKFPKIGRNRSSSQSAKKVGDEGGLVFEARASDPLETSDEILAKYRKPKPEREPPSGDLATEGILVDVTDSQPTTASDCDADHAFQDAKRKLRMMLSEADLSLLPLPFPSRATTENALVWALRVQLAEALNLQDRGLAAKLYETIRCLSPFDGPGCRKLLSSLREDYANRAPYLSYLVRCRQGLLATLAHQTRLASRFEVDESVCASHLVHVCVRIFLERRDSQVVRFVAAFRDAVAADEKAALLERFLQKLWSQMERKSMAMTDLFRQTIERSVVSQVYVYAMHPNGDADVHRDEVFGSHVRRLGVGLTPHHGDLKIPSRFHHETPWPSAQAEIRRLAAYKTPSDKVACVVRTSQTVMNLLSLASSSVPAADDFVPVMVYVLVMANPPGLLSTVQYVDSFYANRMAGEDQYWWVQFTSAIEFIKTMDYKNTSSKE